jgi:type IV secretory pathway TraG/TraD family ATPase VirD4
VRVEHVLQTLALGALLAVLGGHALARLLRRWHLRASWAALALAPAYLALGTGPPALAFEFALLYAWALGARWQREDRDRGADYGEAARTRLRVRDLLIRALWRRRIARGGFIHGERLVVGVDARGLPVSIPVGAHSGKHTLVLGATGAGKTVSAAWVAARLIESGHGAVVIDPKGDEMLRAQLSAAAATRGAEFLQWTPEGSLAYNPYSSGSESEIADKALSGERFTEPHYLRQAQRYLGHAVRAMQAAGVAVTPLTLMAALDPRELEVLARELPAAQAKATERYLDSLSERQQRELAGIRDRLSILAESEARAWLDPGPGRQALELKRAVRSRAVVYFRLDSDRRPLLSAMLAAAIVSDLISLVAALQAEPVATVVLIDEFSALAAEHVSRLFARARSAGISLILSTQELADLRSAGAGASALRDQTLGNVSAVIAHRQNVPASAQLIAAMAGSAPRWRTTQHTEEGPFGAARTGRGSRRRDYELLVHPSQIKALRTGEAVVLTPGDGPPTVARIHSPDRAHARPRRFARVRVQLQRLRETKPNPRRSP